MEAAVTVTALAPDLFRAVMRHQAATVTVVTAGGDRPAVVTATSFTPVSVTPPLVSFRLHRGSSGWPTVRTAPHVAVHLLAPGHAFAGTSWRTGPHGVPLLDGALAWLVCRVVDRISTGDHALVLAEPVAAEWASGTPLLHHDSRYACLY